MGSETRENEEKGWAIRESFAGATVEDVEAFDRVETKVNCFKGNTPENWRRNIPAYNSVSLGEIYKKINLQLKAYNKSAKKLFHLEPYADPGVIRVRIDGAEGLSVDEKGELEIDTGLGTVKFTKPIAYQEVGASGGRPGKLSSDLSTLLASTYIGGSIWDVPYYINLDSAGNVYVVGRTSSSNYPTIPGAYDTTQNGGMDAFVVKLDPGLNPSSYLIGNADGKGSVNIVDVVKARRISLNLALPQELCAVDIDSNTTVDILDVVNILRIALGLPTA